MNKYIWTWSICCGWQWIAYKEGVDNLPLVWLCKICVLCTTSCLKTVYPVRSLSVIKNTTTQTCRKGKRHLVWSCHVVVGGIWSILLVWQTDRVWKPHLFIPHLHAVTWPPQPLLIHEQTSLVSLQYCSVMVFVGHVYFHSFEFVFAQMSHTL